MRGGDEIESGEHKGASRNNRYADPPLIRKVRAPTRKAKK